MNFSFQSDSDSIPVKEFDNRSAGRSRDLSSRPSRQFINNPRIVRDELEERYLNLSDENISLKKQLRHHEERTKHLATKLVRLVGEKSGNSALAKKDTDFVLEEQKERISELEEQVGTLRNKLTIMKRQPQGSFTKLVPTGPRKPTKKASPSPMKSNHTSFPGGPSTSSSRGALQSNGAIVVSDHVTQLLFEAKGENHALRDQLKRVKEELAIADKELLSHKEQLQIKELEHEDEMLAYRFQVESEVDLKKQKIAENMQLLRLQRDSRRTANWLSTYENQCHTLESSLSTADDTIHQLESQIEKIQGELRDEQIKNLNMVKQVEEAVSAINKLKEIETQILSLQDDNRILKESNDSLMSKAFDTGGRSKMGVEKEEDDSLKTQIAQLAQRLRTEIESKAELVASLNQEKAKCLSVQQEIDELKIKCNGLSEQLKESGERLAGDETNANVAAADCGKCLEFETELNQSKSDLVQVRDELEKTKQLLRTQININKEYQKEIEVLSTKLEKAESFHQNKLQDFMKVLEQRTEQLLQLEKNLESFTVGKRSVTPTTSISTMTMTEEPYNVQMKSNPQQQVDISKPHEPSAPYFIRATTPPPPQQSAITKEPETENSPSPTEPTLQIYIDKFEPLNYKLPSDLFATWEFEEYERKYSPVVSNGFFNAKSSHSFSNKRFPIDGIQILIHQAIGEDCKTIASGFLQIGANLVGKIYSTETSSIEEGKLLGHLHYSCIIESFDGENNNIYEQRKPYPKKREESTPFPKLPPLAASTPAPVPRRKSDSTEHRVEAQVQVHEQTPNNQPTSPTAREPTTRKSILRTDTHEIIHAKRVTMNEHSKQNMGQASALQNEITEDPYIIQSQPDMENESGHLETENSTSESVEDDQSQSISISSGSKRKRRQRNASSNPGQKSERQKQSAAAAQNPETTETVEESETSRNATELDSSDTETESTIQVPNSKIRIEVSSVIFNSTNRFWSDSRIKKFFVEYQFLNYPQEELETPSALPKPQPGRPAQFNFVKVFVIDSDEKVRVLRQMLKKRLSIKFTLVSEPGEDDSVECEDLGYGEVCLNNLLAADTDLVNQQIPLYDAENSKVQIGVICITIDALHVLKSIV